MLPLLRRLLTVTGSAAILLLDRVAAPEFAASRVEISIVLLLTTGRSRARRTGSRWTAAAKRGQAPVAQEACLLR